MTSQTANQGLHRFFARFYPVYRVYHDFSEVESSVNNHQVPVAHRTCREHRNTKGNCSVPSGNASENAAESP